MNSRISFLVIGLLSVVGVVSIDVQGHATNFKQVKYPNCYIVNVCGLAGGLRAALYLTVEDPSCEEFGTPPYLYTEQPYLLVYYVPRRSLPAHTTLSIGKRSQLYRIFRCRSTNDCEEAVSGDVTFEEYIYAERALGKVDVVFKDGSKEVVPFVANWCNNSIGACR